MVRSVAVLAALLMGAAPAFAQDRILSIGSSITEIIYALGRGDDVIARDTTSTFPPQANDLPDVGYARALAPEAVLSVAPDLIIATSKAGPKETLDVLDAAGVGFALIEEQPTQQGVTDKIVAVGDALGEQDKARELAAKVNAQMQAASELAAQQAGGTPPKVMFVLSLAGGRVQAAGRNTSAANIIKLAGAENALSGFDGYKLITDEAILHAMPEVILMMDHGGDHSTITETILSMPALAATPAGQNARIVRMDAAHLLGFGPRTASTIHDLAQALYGEVN